MSRKLIIIITLVLLIATTSYALTNGDTFSKKAKDHWAVAVHPMCNIHIIPKYQHAKTYLFITNSPNGKEYRVIRRSPDSDVIFPDDFRDGKGLWPREEGNYHWKCIADGKVIADGIIRVEYDSIKILNLFGKPYPK